MIEELAGEISPRINPTLPDVPAPERVNHPSHYHAASGIEVIDAIEAWGLGYNLGNTVKYVARAGHKGPPLEDLRKAQWYLARAISNVSEGKPA